MIGKVIEEQGQIECFNTCMKIKHDFIARQKMKSEEMAEDPVLPMGTL